MELKPVVHKDDSLNFEASNALDNMIAFIKGRLLIMIITLWGVFSLYAIKTYNTTGKKINLPYLLTEVLVMVVAVLVSYALINRVKPVVEMVGRQVSITNDLISITTFTFNLRFWGNKQPQTLVFKIEELRIRKTDNPLRFIRISDNFDNRVFELRNKTKTGYIVFDYFDVMLKEKLMEILVEVTPQELLMPGRLRHR